MIGFTRPDGTPARDVPGYRQFMPALMPTRAGSSVFFEQRARLDRTLAFVDDHEHASLFHVVLWALVRTLAERPRLYRFVAGGRLWQRDGIWISYTAKTAFDDDAPLVELKRRFDPDVSFVDVVKLVREDVAAMRAAGGTESATDRELALLLKLPHTLRRAAVLVVNRVDALGLLPKSWVEPDPFFASVFVTNLGSIGIDAAFHHLYDYGNVPIFCAIGRVTYDDHGVPWVTLRFTYDERVEDGFYGAKALELLRGYVEDPGTLLRHEPS
jgi:hypothetical protein